MAAEPVQNNARLRRSSDLPRLAPAAAESWRPVDRLDDMAAVEKGLEVLAAVISKEASRTNEDADALDRRVELLRGVIAEYLRPERRDLWLTILNTHVVRAVGRDTDYVWEAFEALHQGCARAHATEAELARAPVVMFSRCQGKGRKHPVVWQLWVLDAARTTPFSRAEAPYTSAQPVCDRSLVLPGPPPPRLPSAAPTMAAEAEALTVSVPCEASADEGHASARDRAAKEEVADPETPYRSAENGPPDAPPRILVVPQTFVSHDRVSYAFIAWAAVGGLAVSISLLVMATTIGASLTDVAAALRDLFNVSWRGVRF